MRAQSVRNADDPIWQSENLPLGREPRGGSTADDTDLTTSSRTHPGQGLLVSTSDLTAALAALPSPDRSIDAPVFGLVIGKRLLAFDRVLRLLRVSIRFMGDCRITTRRVDQSSRNLRIHLGSSPCHPCAVRSRASAARPTVPAMLCWSCRTNRTKSPSRRNLATPTSHQRHHRRVPPAVSLARLVAMFL